MGVGTCNQTKPIKKIKTRKTRGVWGWMGVGVKPSIPTSAVNKLFNSVCSMENKQLSGRQVDGSLFKFSYTFYIELINVMTPPSTFSSSSLSLSLSL